MENLLFAVLALPLGWLLGAVVNWLADDLPHTLHLSRPHYPDGSPRPFSGLIAFMSGRRTSPGGAKLSVRLPIVELGLMLMYGYIALAFPVGYRSVHWLIIVFIMLIITVIDLEHRLILYSVIIPAWLYALVAAALLNERPFIDHVIGFVVGFAIFFLFYFGGILFTVIMANARGEAVEEVAFGFGDVLLAGLAGLILGWQSLIFAIMLTVFLGAFGAILFLIVQYAGRGRYELFTALPYGQYIVLGTLIMMIWRDPIRLFLQGGR